MGRPSLVASSSGQREERTVGEIVAVDEKQLGSARGAVVELELRARDRLRGHWPESMQDRPWERRVRRYAGRPMSRLELHPFTAEFLDDAAVLLSRRHAEHRAVEPGLPADYERVDVARAAIAELATADASGAVATRGATVVGYVVGTPRADPTWGPNVWVEPAGHAVSEPEAASDLYGLAATRWVDEGRTSHYVVVPDGRQPADRRLVQARLRPAACPCDQGGAGGAAHGAAPGARDPAGAARGHRRAGAARARCCLRTSSARPSSRPCAPPPLEEARAEWDDGFRRPGLRDLRRSRRRTRGRLGDRLLRRGVEPAHRPYASRPAGHLGFAAVFEEARGIGTGTALGATIIDWASAEGYPTIVTDWRATNLLSSRTWPKLGFRPTFLRLFRAIA